MRGTSSPVLPVDPPYRRVSGLVTAHTYCPACGEGLDVDCWYDSEEGLTLDGPEVRACPSCRVTFSRDEIRRIENEVHELMDEQAESLLRDAR